jgi:ABC-type bacteriocin/lantibiotic exporter with double-glycine peptidase domain
LIQQVYRGWTTAAGYFSVVGQTAWMLALPVRKSHVADEAQLPFLRSIAVRNVSFAYPSRRRRAVQGIDFQIPAGWSIALVGETGSGKSTLADLLMGLIEPDEGEILIDGKRLAEDSRRAWQRNIAHVPQSIFLADASITQNIALSRPDESVDMERIVAATRTAQLDEFVASLPHGYDTFVGEQGIRLSGGQRQRLGIARAIYKQTPVLVFDEATSALDEETEQRVIEALHGFGRTKTLIMIAHRASTIAYCDMVVRLKGGCLIDVSTPGRGA